MQSYERNVALLKKELENKKPNTEAVKSLMVRTFSVRRKKILAGSQLVVSLCLDNPFLKKAMYVSAVLLSLPQYIDLVACLKNRCQEKWTAFCRETIA